MIDKKKLIVRLTLYPLFIFFVLSIFFFYIYSTPSKKITDINPGELKLNYEKGKIISEDKIELSYWFIPNNKSDKAILLLHGWPADKGDILSNTSFLSSDYNLLYIDFRAMGESGGKYTSGGYKEIKDIKAGIEFLKKKGLKKISLYGYSMGGFSAIMYLLANEDIKSVFADSPYDNIYGVLNDFFKFYGFLGRPVLWFMNIEYKLIYGKYISEFSISRNLSKIKKPIFIICGSKDEICSNKNFVNYGKNSNIKTLLLDGFSHNETIYYKNYKKIVKDFFKETMI